MPSECPGLPLAMAATLWHGAILLKIVRLYYPEIRLLPPVSVIATVPSPFIGERLQKNLYFKGIKGNYGMCS